MLGALTIGSILLSTLGWGINLVMGFVFAGIGGFVYLKAHYLHKFLTAVPDDSRSNPALEKFVALENIFVTLSLLFAIVLLTAAASRVFGEGYPIFG